MTNWNSDSTAATLSATTTTTNAVITYTANGSTPTATGSTTPILITATTTTKAEGFKDGYHASPIASTTITLLTAPANNVASGTYYNGIAPVLSTANGTVEYRINGGAWTDSGLATVTVPLASGPTLTLEARSRQTGYLTSATITNHYDFTVDAISVTPDGGNYTNSTTITLDTTTTNATIAYSTNGTGNWTTGTAFTLDGINNGTGALLAYGSRNGYHTSTTNTTAAYHFYVGNLTLVTNWNSDNTAVTLSATTATTNAVITYTTDNSTPTATGSTAPVSLTATTTAQAIGFKDGYFPSASQNVTIYQLTPPANNLPDGIYYNVIAPNLSTANGTVEYRINGGAWTNAGSSVTPTITEGPTVTIEARSRQAGYLTSASITNTYGFKVATPLTTPNGGNFSNSLAVAFATPTTDATIYYNIANTTWQSGSALTLDGIDNGTGSIQTYATRNHYHTSETNTSETFTFQVGTLRFTTNWNGDNTSATLTAVSGTTNAAITYTADGSTPALNSSPLPIIATGTTTIKAAGFKTNYLASTVAIAQIIQLAPTTISVPSGNYNNSLNTLVTTTNGTVEYRINNGAWINSGTNHIMLTINEGPSVTLDTRSRQTDYLASAITSNTYTFTVGDLTITPNGGNFTNRTTITLASGTTNTTFAYGTNNSGSWATGSSFTLDGINSGTGTIVSYGSRTNYYLSGTNTSAAFHFYAGPVTLTTNWNSDRTTATISGSTPTTNATITYTTDGSTPTANGNTTPVVISTTTTIKSVAFKDGYYDSPTTTLTLIKLAVPSNNLASGDYDNGIAPQLTTTNGTVEYRLNNGAWTNSGASTIRLTIESGPLITLAARSRLTDYLTSDTITNQYRFIVATPAIDPNGGNSSNALRVSFATATTNATLYYATNGSSAWTAGNTVNLDGINSGTGSLSTFATRAGYYNSTTNTSAVFTFTVAPPQITTAWNSDNTQITLTATTATTNAIIRYTSDGTEPTATSTTTPPTVNTTSTIKASGFKDGYLPSSTTQTNIIQLAAPTANYTNGTTFNNASSITLSHPDSNATLLWTNAAGPWNTYTQPLNLDGNQTLTTRASRSGYLTSTNNSYTYNFLVAPIQLTPTYNSDGTTVTVAGTSVTTNTLIYYTSNGTNPTTNSQTTPPTLMAAGIVKAQGYKTAYSSSAVATLTISRAQTPDLVPATGSFFNSTNITISTADSEPYLIQYQTNGSGWLAYNEPVALDGTTLLAARVQKPDCLSSPITNTTYTFHVAPLTVFTNWNSDRTAATLSATTLTTNSTITYTVNRTNSSTDLPVIRETSTVTIVARKPNYQDSPTQTLNIAQLATPRFTLGATNNLINQTNVAIFSTNTPAGQIEYRINGSAWTSYLNALTLDGTTTLLARVQNDGYITSLTGTANYRFYVGDLTLTKTFNSDATAVTVTAATATTNAILRYSTDGSNPAASDNTIAAYLQTPATVKAIGEKTNYDSATASLYVGQAAAPAITPAPGTYYNNQQLTITSSENQATLEYRTNGSSWYAYSTAVSINDATTIEARTKLADKLTSTNTTQTYTFKVATPAFQISWNSDHTAATLSGHTITTNAALYYTTDGTTPSSDSPTNYPLVTVSTTLKTFGQKPGYLDSEVAVTNISQALPPQISVQNGTYTNDILVAITAAETNMVIEYSLNGGSWNTYYNPLLLNGNTSPLGQVTLVARARRNDLLSSTTSARSYTFKVGDTVTTPNEGSYQNSIILNVQTGTTNAVLQMTADNLVLLQVNTNRTTYLLDGIAEGTGALTIRATRYAYLSQTNISGTFQFNVANITHTPDTQFTNTLSVTAATTTTNAVIRYEEAADANTPADVTTNSAIWTTRIIGETKNYNWRAFKNGYSASDQEFAHLARKLNTPTININGGNFVNPVNLTITSPNNGILHVKFGNADWVTSSSGVLTTNLDGINDGTGVIQTYVTRPGWLTSETLTTAPFTFYIGDTAALTLSTNWGGYNTNATISAATITTGTTLAYTTDGSEPTTDATANAPLLTQTTTLKVKAFKTGYLSAATLTVTLTKLNTPTISKASGRYNNDFPVSLTAANPNDTGIAVVLDNTEPRAATNNTTPAVNLTITGNSQGQLRTVAKTDGYLTSDEASATYTFQALPPIPLTDRIFKGNLTITVAPSATTNAATHYEMGDAYGNPPATTPNTNSALWLSDTSIAETRSIQFVATKDDYANSAVVTSFFQAKVSNLSITADQTYTETLSLTASTPTPNAIIRFTVGDDNGSTPEDPTESSAIWVNQAITAAKTMKFIGYRTSFLPSDMVTGKYVRQVSAPSLSINGGNFSNSLTLTLTSGTASNLTYQIADRSPITSSGTTTTFELDGIPTGTGQIKTYATRPGWANSPTTTSDTFVFQVATPAVEPEDAIFTNSFYATAATTTTNATLRFNAGARGGGEAPTVTATSTPFDQPFLVESSRQISVCGYKANYLASDVIIRTYRKRLSAPVIFPRNATLNEPIHGIATVAQLNTDAGDNGTLYVNGPLAPQQITFDNGKISNPVFFGGPGTYAFTLKRNWWADSETITSTYQFTLADLNVTPSQTFNEQLTIIANSKAPYITPALSVYYRTDGTKPSTNDTLFPTGGITINNNAIISFGGFRTGYLPQFITNSYQRISGMTITPSQVFQNNLTVTAESYPPGSPITYAIGDEFGNPPTGNPTTPWVNSLILDRSANITFRLSIAGQAVVNISRIYTATVATPTIAPDPGGIRDNSGYTTIATATKNAYLTVIDGVQSSNYNTNNYQYGPILGPGHLTIVARKNGWQSSTNTSQTIYTSDIALPTITPDGTNDFQSPLTVTITNSSALNQLWYRIDKDNISGSSPWIQATSNNRAQCTINYAATVSAFATNALTQQASLTVQSIFNRAMPVPTIINQAGVVTISVNSEAANPYIWVNGDANLGSNTVRRYDQTTALSVKATALGWLDSATANYTVHIKELTATPSQTFTNSLVIAAEAAENSTLAITMGNDNGQLTDAHTSIDTRTNNWATTIATSRKVIVTMNRYGTTTSLTNTYTATVLPPALILPTALVEGRIVIINPTTDQTINQIQIDSQPLITLTNDQFALRAGPHTYSITAHRTGWQSSLPVVTNITATVSTTYLTNTVADYWTLPATLDNVSVYATNTHLTATADTLYFHHAWLTDTTPPETNYLGHVPFVTNATGNYTIDHRVIMFRNGEITVGPTRSTAITIGRADFTIDDPTPGEIFHTNVVHFRVLKIKPNPTLRITQLQLLDPEHHRAYNLDSKLTNGTYTILGNQAGKDRVLVRYQRNNEWVYSYLRFQTLAPEIKGRNDQDLNKLVILPALPYRTGQDPVTVNVQEGQSGSVNLPSGDWPANNPYTTGGVSLVDPTKNLWYESRYQLYPRYADDWDNLNADNYDPSN
ncbi:MAG: chitobiase/beta-hexosaminidase C-terminal domain-containing protein [Verrucomicrobiota bacterium]